MSTTRHSYRHQGQTVYEWDQTLSDVNVYIPGVPEGVTGKQLDILIRPTRVSVGVRDTPPYLDKQLTEVVKAEESVWTFDPETRELHIQLCKAEEARVWECVFVGHRQEQQSGDPEGDKKRLMLERFQRDHPGFDFSGAEFTGNVPCIVGRYYTRVVCRRVSEVDGPYFRRGLLVCPRVSQREDHQSTVDEYSGAADDERGVLDVTCVGFGGRGVDALRRVHESGCMPRTTSLWCLETDMNMIEAAKEYANVLHMDSNKGCLSPDDVMRIIGRTASDAGGQGNIGSGDGCLAFVIAPSTGIPGGRDSLLQVTQTFRAAGHFTVAAVVSPFDFEGSLKKKQSEELVAELSALAHVVVVLDQDVLLRQSYGDEQQLTVAESTEIANTALEHTVRCVVQAVLASEMLKSTQGGLMWHGEELRHFKRLISPPLQNLLTGKGVGVLGRGLASLPQKAASSMGHTSALMHLASDAVAGAAESPFMEGVVEKARGVLCCLRIPDSASLADVLGPADEVEMDKAYRMAAQASAGALRTITGRGCDDFLVFIEKYRPEQPSTIQVEATMLVLWSNDLAGTPKASWKSSWNIPVNQSTKKQNVDVNDQKSWGMLSALAGGEGKKSKVVAKEKETPLRPVVKRPVVVRPSREEKAASQRDAQQNVTVGDYLAESLTAQSLDLPPAAARWRQEHRSDSMKQRRLVVWEVDEEEEWESETPRNPLKAILGDKSQPQQKKKVNVRDRVAGILAQDRDEAWEAHVRDTMSDNNIN